MQMEASKERTLLERVFRDFHGDPALTVHQVTCEPGCEEATNFLSVVRRKTVTGTLGVGANRAFLRRVIVKQQLPDPRARASLNGDKAFTNEILAYAGIIPALDRLCPEQPLPYPRCLFGGRDANLGDLLVLEDLRESGFRPLAVPLTLGHCQLVLQKFAHLHAAGMVLRIVNCEEFERVLGSIDDFHFRTGADQQFPALFAETTNRTLRSLRASNGDGVLTEAIQLIEGHLSGENLFRIMQGVVHRDQALTLCHGDSWLNNVLFRCNDKGRVDDVRFVDLQLMRHASLTTDLLHFLYSSTDTAFRRQYYGELLAGYQKSLVEWIDRLAGPHLDEEGVRDLVEQLKGALTLARLKEQMHQNSIYGLGQCLLLLPVFTMTPNEMLGYADYPEEFHRRTRETVMEFCEMGVLEDTFLRNIRV